MDTETTISSDTNLSQRLGTSTATASGATLTHIELRLLQWLAVGRTNAQIGRCLGRSEKTVRNQLTRVYAKLGVVNRTEAVAVHLRREFGKER